MDPSIRHIITRAVTVIAIIIALIYGYGIIKKHQRKSATISQLQLICSESSYFRQFSEDEAKKTLIRAIGFVAEADFLGINPDDSIKAALGQKKEWFDGSQTDPDDIPPAQHIIRSSLRANYDNFLKLGYKPEFEIIKSMKDGQLPAIPSGSLAGRKPIIKSLIPTAASPGIEKVLANLELAPPGSEETRLTDIQLAAAKQLARDLANARIIEQSVRDRIIEFLSPKLEEKKL